jgi:hypothetical protein
MANLKVSIIEKIKVNGRWTNKPVRVPKQKSNGKGFYLRDCREGKFLRRRCNRVPCRGARACLNVGSSTSIIGEMPNVSRNGMCFRTVEQFLPEALISIATYYTEGSQNIFRGGRVIWTRDIESGASEYGIEFADARYS